MSDEVYRKLAKVLDALPKYFPSMESGVEIKILKRIFKPDDVELFCDLKAGYLKFSQVSVEEKSEFDIFSFFAISFNRTAPI